MSQRHTKEPWRVVSGDDYHIDADAYPKGFPHTFKEDDTGSHLATVGNRTPDFGTDNAHRIVACVNGCAGLDPSLLQEVVKAARGMVAVNHFSTCDGSQVEARDKLEALLDRLEAQQEP